jgi:hypothetical protein
MSTHLRSLSAIIICHFHLDLQVHRRNEHPNTNTSKSLSSFHAATQWIHDTVMTEFGDSLSDSLSDEGVGAEAEGSPHAMVPADRDMPPEMTENVIGLVEIQPRPQDSEITLET